MLLEFKMKNYKSFKQELDFKMIPTRIKDLEYSIICKEINNEKMIKALSSSVIYGPNSSGKTNIIGGMDVLRSIVLEGNIKNKETVTTPNTAVDRLELIPNIESKSDEPVSFSIKFYSQGFIFDYNLSILIGEFLDLEFDRQIINEELYINNSMIYKRNDDLTIGRLDVIDDYKIENFSKETAEKIARTNLDGKELFLNGMFKSLYSKKIFDIIYEWFKNNFKIIYHFDKMHILPTISSNEPNKKLFVDKNLNKAAKIFGLTSKQISYQIDNDNGVSTPLSIIESKGKNVGLPADWFESFGTLRFTNIFPLILVAIKERIYISS